jgi:ketosteroid isomerase-like protein
MKAAPFFAFVVLSAALCLGAERPRTDEGSYVLALDNSWNRALETKDTKALDMILADSFVSIDTDGSIQNKAEFLAGIKSPDYHPPAQAVTEQSSVSTYGDSAVVVGIFRTQGVEKGKKFINRERFVDTWVKTNGTWKCVAAITVMITSK